MIEKTVAEIAVALNAGDISSVELTQTYLDRITQFNGELNAYITVCADSALRQAKTADEKRAKGDTSPTRFSAPGNAYQSDGRNAP